MSFDWRNITLPDQRQEWTWRSPALDRDMSVCRWGHFGKPVVMFPTAGGDYLECERYMLVKSIAPLIEAGRIKVFAIGSITGDGWLNRDATPAQRTRLQARFADYLSRELLPFVRHQCGDTKDRFAAVGASLGAYNALNAVCRNPDWFDLAVAMSGTYDFKRWMDGHFDEDYYFHMPLHYLPRVPQGQLLDRLRTTKIALGTGSGRAEAPWESEWIARILETQGIPHHLEVWGPDVHHDWPTWRTMLPLFLSRLA